MCEALRKLMKDDIAAEVAEASAKAMEKGREEGLEKGLEEGLEKGTDTAIFSSIVNLMDTMKWTAEQAMEAIKVPAADRSKYMSRL